MTRTQQTDEPASSSRATDPFAAPVEAVLPEHVLLRMLHERCGATGDLQPDIEFALRFACLIAAKQSLESIQECPAIDGSERPLDDDAAEEAADDCFDLADLEKELDIVCDIEPSTNPTERSEAESVSNQPNAPATGEAVEDEAVPATEPQESDAIDACEANDEDVAEANAEELEEPIDEQALGATVREAAMEPATSEETDESLAAIEANASDPYFGDEELGALMADIGGSGVDPDEEQQELQDVFGDPDAISARTKATQTPEGKVAAEPEEVLHPAPRDEVDTDTNTAEQAAKEAADSPAEATPASDENPIASDTAQAQAEQATPAAATAL